jgi:hypothetical protein
VLRRAVTIAIAAALASGLTASASAGAHTLRASDRASLHYVSASGALLEEVGSASGTLPGDMRVQLRLASVFSGSFTITTRYGSISGHGTATPHGYGTYESFAGTLVATGGSGRFRHAHGSARLYGTFDRSNYALVMQTTGTLYY